MGLFLLLCGTSSAKRHVLRDYVVLGASECRITCMRKDMSGEDGVHLIDMGALGGSGPLDR